MKTVKQIIEENHNEMVEYLRRIVEFESPSRDKEKLDVLAEWIASTFRKLVGGKAEIIPVENYGNHVRCEWGEGEEQILILSHFDTVWPAGTLEKNPFRIEGDRAYGPGVFDMKGGLIQGLFALKALREAGIKLNKKIVFFFDSDEEIGNPTSKKFIEKEAQKSERVFVLEPAMTLEGGLKTSRKGVGIYELSVKGIPSHSGIDPDKGVSAIDELAKQIVRLHSETDLTTGTTINVGEISGGSTVNVIAEHAHAEIDVRAKTVEELNRIDRLILGLKPINEKTQVVTTGEINRMPLERTEKVQEMFEVAKNIAENDIGFTLIEKETGGGSDGNLTAPFAPTLDGLGAVGDGAHANHEHLLVSHMPKRSALFAELLLHYAGIKEGAGIGDTNNRS
ncbi:M20 family metallopeptidase [Bacillus sp. MRMR6]|uniref:M20 family metallopeptidase n=1 Tax=Bacillus sp. MRMR6 TaxID=1928617 RepID=UPI000950D472|nr:M20 family metallopeptidase [Bacillus sp. MRMR6]OLS37307.1 peptidase M20 [Bacillus sp. MRMR6]